MCPFDYTAVAGSGTVGPVNQVNHTSWVAVITPTDRTKSVCNCCVIELFVALFVLSLCPFDISVGVGAFVIGLSQISSFFSLYHTGVSNTRTCSPPILLRSKPRQLKPFYCINEKHTCNSTNAIVLSIRNNYYHCRMNHY